MFGWGKKNKTTAVEPASSSTPAVAEKPKEKEKEKEKHSHSSDLKVKVSDRQPCQVTLSIQVPAAKVEEATERSFREIQGKAKLPGFRPGKAPLDLVRKNFEGSAREQALDRLLRESVHEALESEKIEPVATPVVDKIEYDLQKPLKFELKVECAPEVVLKDYKSLKLSKKTKVFSDEDISKKIEEIRDSNSKLIVSNDTTVSDKHFVIVDYVGKLDGQPIEGGKAQGQLIDMSAPQTISGFTEGLRDAKLGETKSIPVTFPEDHFNKALAGKPVNFEVTVTAIKEKQLPALDDEFAKDVGCQSLDDLKDRLRKNMEREFERTVRHELEKQVTDQVLAAHDFAVPPSMVTERTHYLNNHLKQYLMRQGGTEEDWKANEEKMTEKNKLEAERQVRLSYLLTSIARAEKIEVSEQELEETVQKSVDGAAPDKRGELQKWMSSQKDHLRQQLIEERIYSRLIESAQVTETKE